MTTVIIDGKTKAIYTDTRQTQTTSGGTYSFLGFNLKHNKSTQIHLIDDGVKCHYISKEVGYITSTGCVYLFNECVRLSKQHNEFTLPKLHNGYSSTTILNVKLKDNGYLEVIKYVPKTQNGLFSSKHYWQNNWTLLSDTGIQFYGSGSDYAQGAYCAGISPKDAIIAASKCDHYTNANVQIYNIE